MSKTKEWVRSLVKDLIEEKELIPQEVYEPISWRYPGSHGLGECRRATDAREKLRVVVCSECGSHFVLNQFQHYQKCSLCWYSYQMNRPIDV